MIDHGAVDGLQILPVRDLPEVRPGDDIAELIARHAEWLA